MRNRVSIVSNEDYFGVLVSAPSPPGIVFALLALWLFGWVSACLAAAAAIAGVNGPWASGDTAAILFLGPFLLIWVVVLFPLLWWQFGTEVVLLSPQSLLLEKRLLGMSFNRRVYEPGEIRTLELAEPFGAMGVYTAPFSARRVPESLPLVSRLAASWGLGGGSLRLVTDDRSTDHFGILLDAEASEEVRDALLDRWKRLAQ